MATLQYKSSLGRYRRYLQTVQNQPLVKASLFVILSLLLVIVLVVMALRPTLVTIAGLIGQTKQQQELEQQMDHKINLLKEAQNQLALASANLTYLNDAVPTSANVSTWVDSLTRVASESAVAVNGVSVANLPVGRVAENTPLNFKVSVSGTYVSVHQFLQVMQSLRRLIKIDTLEIARQGLDDNTVVLNIAGSLLASP